MPDKRGAVEINSPAETNLVGRRFAGFNEAGVGAEVVNAVHDVARFDARDVHRIQSDWLNPEVAAGGHDGIVDFEGMAAFDPDLVAKIAGITCPGNNDIDIVELRFR